MEGPGEEVLEEDREEERVENVVEKADKASEGGDKEKEAVFIEDNVEQRLVDHEHHLQVISEIVL